ncbi:MAG: hypothetical protein QM500_10195 [Methylococcales bacterium]
MFSDVLRVHRNAQRLIKSLKVVNPFAEKLTFLNDKTRTRRDHKKYLTLIRSITLLHQYQREIKSTYCNDELIQYVEVTLDDIELANQLSHEVLGRSLDEIPPQTQRLLSLIDRFVTVQCNETQVSRKTFQFTRRDVREYTGWGDTQLKVHLQRLESMEYLLIQRGGPGRLIVYELLYSSEGQNGEPFLMGLLDVSGLKKQMYVEPQSGQTATQSPTSPSHVGEKSASSQQTKTPVSHNKNNTLSHESSNRETNTKLDVNNLMDHTVVTGDHKHNGEQV